MSSTRKRDPEATREAILNAAEALILEKGFSGTPISAIASKAGVTKSLIHHYFGSKSGLWSAVKMRRLSEYSAHQMRLLESSEGDENLLRNSIVAYFRFLQSSPDVLRLITWVSLEDEPLCMEEQRELFELGIRRLEEAQQAGMLRKDIPAPFMLVSFLSLAQGWFREGRAKDMAFLGVEPGPETDERYLEAMLKLFFEGVAPR